MPPGSDIARVVCCPHKSRMYPGYCGSLDVSLVFPWSGFLRPLGSYVPVLVYYVPQFYRVLCPHDPTVLLCFLGSKALYSPVLQVPFAPGSCVSQGPMFLGLGSFFCRVLHSQFGSLCSPGLGSNIIQHYRDQCLTGLCAPQVWVSSCSNGPMIQVPNFPMVRFLFLRAPIFLCSYVSQV